MFEKEAEEYSEKDLGDKYISSVVAKDKLHAYKLGQYDGFVAGAEFGYNKANEWHFVKDEGLPKNNNDGTTYFLYTIYGLGGSPVVAHFAYRDKQELMNVWTGAILTEDKIIAWKEIVLPKESE